MIQVSKNLYIETGMTACNLGFLVTQAGVVMIDSPMKPSDALTWRGEAARHGDIRYCICTEEHPDHWQGTYFFPGTFITSAETRKKLSRFPADFAPKWVNKVEPQSTPLMEDYRVRLADLTFTEQMELHLGSHTIQLLAVPGHSTGGIAVYIPEERVVFTTDIVFHEKASWLPEADPAKWLAALKKLSELDVEIVVPGHGDLCNKDYIPQQAAIIQQWTEVVRSAIKQGLTVEEAAAKIVSPDPHPKQAGTPLTDAELHQANIRRLYQLYA